MDAQSQPGPHSHRHVDTYSNPDVHRDPNNRVNIRVFGNSYARRHADSAAYVSGYRYAHCHVDTYSDPDVQSDPNNRVNIYIIADPDLGSSGRNTDNYERA